MISELVSAVITLFSWPLIGFVVLGCLLGIFFGALPGLGGAIGIALLIPVSFGMESSHAMAMFAALLGGVAFGGSISAILLNVPGTAPNAATCFDGYPMARKGQADVALGISATASALGAIFGLIVLLALIPVARELILMFGLPEFFWLAILGLTVIAVATRKSLLKSLAAGGLGLLLSLVGYSGLTGAERYTFDLTYLWDGIELIPALIGIFAIGEVLKLMDEGGTISQDAIESETEFGNILQGVKAVLVRPVTFFRSALVGLLIGLVPGAGGTVANFISYGAAQQSSSRPNDFGTGIPEGIIASEAANDAKDGGALLPTVVFGIPGSAGMAVLLGAFVLHGIKTGSELLTTDIQILYIMIFSLLVSNILTSILGLSFASHLAKLTYVPVGVLIPWILVISLLGSFAYRNLFGDVILAIAFGFLGYAFLKFGYSRVALILGLILGPLAERSLFQAYMIGGYGMLFSSTISKILVFFIITSLAISVVRQVRSREFETDQLVQDGGNRK